MCASCRTIELAKLRLWSPRYVCVVGAVMLPVGWVLAAINWWRLGQRWKAFGLPFAAAALRLVAVVAVRLGVDQRPGQTAVLVGIALLVNLLTMLVAVIGQWSLVDAQRVAGGQSANRVVPIVAAVVPLFCFVGLYWFFLGYWGRLTD